MNLSSHTQRRNEGSSPAPRRRRGTLALAISTILMLVVGLFAAPLSAQSGSENRVDFETLQVDVRDTTGTIVVRPAAGAEGGELTVEIEGEEIVASVAPIFQTSVRSQTIVVIDDSQNADDIAGFSAIRDAALAFVDGLSADTEIMLVRAGGGRNEITPEVGFTNNHATIRSAINGLSPGGGAVTYDAIGQSVRAFADQGDTIRNVVAFIGSPGGNSNLTPDATRGRLLGVDASLTVVAPRTTNLDISGFASIADAVRGGAVFRGVSAESNMTVAAQNAAATQQSYLVGTFSTSSIIDARSDNGQGEDGTNELTVRYAGDSERVRILPNGIVDGAGLNAPLLAESSRFSIFEGNTVALVAIALIVVAVLVFAFSLMQILAGSDNTLNSTLSVYGSQDAKTDAQIEADDAFASNRSRIIEQVVERAEEAAEARGSLNSTTNLLEKAEIPLRAGEAFAIQVALVLFAFVLGFLIFGTSLLGGLALALPAAIIPSVIVRRKVEARARRIEEQLPDTLNLLASTLKAGYSFLQGIDAVGNEAEEPLAGEFRRTVNEARLGKDMDIALDDLADRVDSQDMVWAIVAIKIQREVGGNLAELLSIVAETMQSRARLRGEVRALTAEGRISAIVLVCLPFLVGLAMFFLNRDYLSELWTNNIGLVMVGVALISMTIGGFWMRKIIDIEL